MEEEHRPACAHCGAEKVYKNGWPKGRRRCAVCRKDFFDPLPSKASKRQRVVQLYSSGVSFRQTARLEGISHTTAREWVRQAGEALPERPEPKTPPRVIEFDEQWHFLQKNL